MKIKKMSELFTFPETKNINKFINVINKLNRNYYDKILDIEVKYENAYYKSGEILFKDKTDTINFRYENIIYENHGDHHEFEIRQKDSTFEQRLEFCINKDTKKIKREDICIVYKFGDYTDISQKVSHYGSIVENILDLITESINELREYKLID